MEATASTHGILAPEALGARFTLERRAPAAALAELVERHWIVRWSLPDGESFVQELLPHPCVNLVSERDRSAVYGIPSTRSSHRLEGSGLAVGTKFRPGAFAAVAGVPAGGLRAAAIPLPALFGDDGARLERALAERTGRPELQIDAVERFLLERLPAPDPRLRLLRRVVADMLTADPRTSVAELAERHAVSPRTLQRLFHDYVGVGPKWVLRRYRVHLAAELIAAGEADDLAALALDLGYFDQAHLARDFTAQVGRSPGTYARLCAAAAGRSTPVERVPAAAR